ncbi:hypothetical protein LCGC14_0863010 [marine sediment metagenome]|uniref:Uncharacterized protein n=1 Tax=marine sediment metagenome TaxID=412755 RepID=A0A0F9PBV7_9ZZZZ
MKYNKKLGWLFMLGGFGLTFAAVKLIENTIIGLSLFFIVCLPMIVLGSTLAGGSPKFVEDRLNMEVL